MAAILGLIGTEDFSSHRYTNVRRKVFYDYPNGSAPLMGILSLLPEEDTDDPEFSWYEKRLIEQRTETASQGGSKGPFKTALDADAGDPVSFVTTTEQIVVVDSNSYFRKGHIIQIPVTTGGTTTSFLRGRITEEPATTGTGKIKFVPLADKASVDNGTTNENVDREVLVIGSAWEQGAAGSSEAVWTEPVNPGNYCQIFRSEFSFTGTALKTGMKFDKTGPYKDKAKEASILHMIEMERAALFGTKSKKVSGTTGMPTYTSGGILYFLELWEAGSTYGNTAATLDTQDGKRIISNAAGTLTEKQYDGYLERVFRVTNNKANEKLVLCGSGFLNVINQLYKSKATLDSSLPMTATYGMDVVKHRTPFGTLYYKSHPLFNQNSSLRYNALIVDVQNLRYRYVQGRDTNLLKNRQNNNVDARVDEWLGEVGWEVRFPESHMYIQNVQDFAA